MKQSDVRWCLVGVIFGLWVAYGTLQKSGFLLEAPIISRAIGNVIGTTIVMFVVGRIISRFRKPS